MPWLEWQEGEALLRQEAEALLRLREQRLSVVFKPAAPLVGALLRQKDRVALSPHGVIGPHNVKETSQRSNWTVALPQRGLVPRPLDRQHYC